MPLPSQKVITRTAWGIFLLVLVGVAFSLRSVWNEEIGTFKVGDIILGPLYRIAIMALFGHLLWWVVKERRKRATFFKNRQNIGYLLTIAGIIVSLTAIRYIFF